MKIGSIIGFILALILIIVNLTKVNFDQLLDPDSTVALIGIVSGLIVVLLICIYNISKKIERKIKS